MIYEVIAFTKKGKELAEHIKSAAAHKDSKDCYHINWKFSQEQYAESDPEKTQKNARKNQAQKNEPSMQVEGSLREWCREVFEKADGILFIGAAGIAVRSIAPFIKSKVTDPAVVVMDEKGQFAIPILSGHLGGANGWSRQLALWTGGTAVLTTASDVNEKIAVDVMAQKNHLVITDYKKIKEIAAAIVAEQPVALYCGLKLKGVVPPELYLVKDVPEAVQMAEQNKPGIWISEYRPPEQAEKFLHLIPQTVSLGIGCKKGKTQEEIEEVLLEVLHKTGISMEALGLAASIHLKKNEPGIRGLCKKYGLEFQTFSSEELQRVEGNFTASGFVQEKTGVDNVCERAAQAGAEKFSPACVEIIQRKYAKNGVTIALARFGQEIQF